MLEEELALANIALDLIGQARMLYQAAGELTGHSEDELAYLRDPPAFRNALIMELPNGDFAFTIARLFLVSVASDQKWRGGFADPALTAVAEKAMKETAYHVRHSAEWLIRLGDGTAESHRRAQDAVDALWPFTGELTETREHLAARSGARAEPGNLMAAEGWLDAKRRADRPAYRASRASAGGDAGAASDLSWCDMVATLLERARAAAAAVTDPELPPLTVDDLGILRDVRLDNGTVEVAITPTYSGCPAMREIADAIERAVREAGVEKVRVRHVLTPAWTTDWLTDTARAKLLALGIAPPSSGSGAESLFARAAVPCPRCRSANTERISAFGSTACKALHRCLDCKEPFEAFKCH